MSDITINIRAAADPSMRNAFRPLEDSVRRARAVMQQMNAGMAADAAVSARAMADAMAQGLGRQRDARGRATSQQRQVLQQSLADDLKAVDQAMRQERMLRGRASDDHVRDVERRHRAEEAAEDRARRQKQRADIRDFDERLRTSRRAREHEEREIVRGVQRVDREQARAGQRSGRERYERFAAGATSVGNDMRRLGAGAVGVSRGFLQGAGVDTSIGGTYGRAVDFERRVTELSNSGYNAADPRNNKRRDPAELSGIIKGAADANAYGRVETAQGLQSFVGKTGDLQTGLDILKELGKVSKATGTDMQDMLDAAGDVSNALGENFTGDRGKAVITAMKSFAGQGKLGAVEIKDLATQMAKLGSAATSFEGDPTQILATMGGLAQMSRKMGGSATATQAATSVASMVNTLKTPARMAQFKEFGVDILNEKTGMLRNPEEIILDSIEKAGTDPAKFKKMWANTGGARAVEGYAATYRKERGAVLDRGGSDDEANAAARNAVLKAFKDMREAALGDAEINDSFAARMGNTDSRAQLQSNRMEDVAQRVGDKLLPALEKLAPLIEKVADAFGGIVAWAAENPMKAVVAALVASVGKAAITQSVSTALSNAIMRGGAANGVGAIGAGGGGGGGVGGSPVAGALATGAAVLGVGLAIEQYEGLDRDLSAGGLTEGGQAEDRAIGRGKELDARKAAMASGDYQYLERLQTTKYLQAGFTSKAQYQEVGASMFETMGIQDPGAEYEDEIRIAKAKRSRMPVAAEMGAGMAGPGGGRAGIDEGKLAGAVAEGLRGPLSGTLNVNVTNMPAGGGPFVDPSGLDGGDVPVGE